MVTQTNPTSAPPPAEKPEFTPEEDQIEVIETLAQWQQKLGKPDTTFCRDHLAYSPAVWSRIQSGEYWKMVRSPLAVIAQLRKDLRRLEREQVIAARHAGAEWFAFDDNRAIMQAIDECRAKNLSDPDRLITYLADTGGGKTRLCGRLHEEHGAIVVQAREAWKTSYFNCLKDFCDAVGVDTKANSNKGLMELEIINALNKRRTVIAVDEGEFFGAQSLNLIKLILNSTPTVMVICAIPEAYARWNRANWHEARQIRRRTHVLIHQEAIHPSEAAKFLASGPAKAIAKEAAPFLAAAANQFGRFDTCKRVARALADGDDSPTLDDVKKAIARVQTFLGFNPGRR